jgi:hypothetical protein
MHEFCATAYSGMHVAAPAVRFPLSVITNDTARFSFRRPIALVLALGLGGMLVELLLVGHYEDGLQYVPLAALGFGLAALGWFAAAPQRSSRRVFRAAMLLLVAAGLAGIGLHYRGNREFQLEADPTRHGLELLLAVLRAKAPPALAPGQMALLGLLGLVGEEPLASPSKQWRNS